MAFELKEEGFKLKNVLKVLNIPEATYHYHIQQLKKEDPDKKLKEKITELFQKHDGKYGYRRIHLELKGEGKTN
ncbi:IS3 family transposase [Scopulibacillus daqui]|uniref:IS3 family transposase n=1 Tax=Scopulibacillus daqui TaxID=1469162 RepID=UPI0035EA69C4